MKFDKFSGTNERISPTAKIGKNVKIGDNTIIYDNVEIGDNTIICIGRAVECLLLRYGKL